MSFSKRYLLTLVMTAGLGLSGMNAEAIVNVQCPGDTNGDGVSDTPGIECRHLSGSDGFMRMADGRAGLYIFGFSNLTGKPIAESLSWGTLAAQFAAPTLYFKEGDKVYLTLSNAGTVMRPDLFDPHSVHWHGFPNAGTVYDGEPEASISINPSASLTYYYEPVEVGTFMYHCHVEAAEHMEMGMLGNLYVMPKQNELPPQTFPNGFVHVAGNKYVYNDGDGSTRYDIEFPIQIGLMDPVFHDLHLGVQPLPFANLLDTYPMLNGRGYPDTVNPAPLPAPEEKVAANYRSASVTSNPQSSFIQAQAGQKILLRISNLNITTFNSLSAMGLPMKVVGTGAHILKGPNGLPAYYDTNSVTLGGGEALDVIIDTTGVPAGTYFLYSTNLNYLSNNTEDFGGMMTEIKIL
jgi:FtsP/CotA-like multicopper oxidase with cupredoxin domain